MDNIKKIFENFDYIKSKENKGFKILLEFLETQKKLEEMHIKNIIVMFGSARIKPENDAKANIVSKYYALAYQLSYKLAMWTKQKYAHKSSEDKFYICTGGGGGIMEAANKGAKEAGEITLGFNIKLPFEQNSNSYIEKNYAFWFNYFFLRKFWFTYLAKAFIVFPGGFGTLDELFEVLTLSQTYKMKKRIPFVIFGKDFFNKILNLDMLIQYGLIAEKDKDIFIITDDIEEAYNHVITNIKSHSALLI